MKKTLMVMLGLLLMTGIGYAQNSSGLKGPKAKNTKPWKHDQNKTKIMLVEPQQERTVGPKAKNTVMDEKESQIVFTQEMMPASSRIGKSGPNAKNHRPGRN